MSSLIATYEFDIKMPNDAFPNARVASAGWGVFPSDEPHRPFRVRSTSRGLPIVGAGRDKSAWDTLLAGAATGDPDHAAALVFLAGHSPAELQAIRDHHAARVTAEPPKLSEAANKTIEAVLLGAFATVLGTGIFLVGSLLVGKGILLAGTGGEWSLATLPSVAIGAIVLGCCGVAGYVMDRRWGVFR